MIPRTIAQAIYTDRTVQSRSDDFDEAWQTEAERIIAAFGLPDDISVPESLVAVPFARRHVAVVSVAGRRYRFLVLHRSLYNVIPDPFSIAERFPPPWGSSRVLPTLEWPEEPLPHRTI